MRALLSVDAMVMKRPQLEMFGTACVERAGASSAARAGAGRGVRAGQKRGPKARVERKGFARHVPRDAHLGRHPVHVTMRRVRLAPSFRSETVRLAIMDEIAGAKGRGVRVVHFSIQEDHLHLMVEGEDSKDLSKQMCRLFSRVAMAVNRVAQRSGPLFRDRHHRHALRTPTETRNALVYIMFNIRKHDAASYTAAQLRTVLDAFSSAAWFERWHPDARPPAELLAKARARWPTNATSAPQTWLAKTGWLRAGGPIRFTELPRRAR